MEFSQIENLEIGLRTRFFHDGMALVNGRAK